MAELRHATMAAAVTRATSSPSKRDAEAASASSSLVACSRVGGGGGGGKDGSAHSVRARLVSSWFLSASYRDEQTVVGEQTRRWWGRVEENGDWNLGEGIERQIWGNSSEG